MKGPFRILWGWSAFFRPLIGAERRVWDSLHEAWSGQMDMTEN